MDIGVKKVFGNLVKKMRHSYKGKKLTQNELASNAGVHPNTIFNIEHGSTDPSLSTMFFISRGLDMELHVLMRQFVEAYYRDLIK